MTYVKTVGELKAALANIADDTIILKYSSNMETHGYFPGLGIKIEKVTKVKRDTWDRFDGGNYSYEAYDLSKDGEISGLCI